MTTQPQEYLFANQKRLKEYLADATLLYIANKENIKNIVSIDIDFDIYRTLKKQSLNNLLK